MAVDTTTFLGDAKIVYGTLKDQVGQEAVIFNLFRDGTKFAKPITDAGIRGYVFGARLKPNYRMGYRAEGTSGIAPGNQGLAQATVTLKYAYVPVLITGQANVLTQGSERAFMQAKALEAKYDMKDLLSHINVVVCGAERGGELARVASSPAPGAGTFTADTASNLPGALYLKVGMPISATPVGGGTLTVTNRTITAVNYTTHAVTHATDTATAGDAVYLNGEGASTTGAFPLTVEGFVSLIASSGSRQGLNPATTDQETWAAFQSDVGNVDLTVQIMTEMCQFITNRGGQQVKTIFAPSAQINKMTNIATTNMRYNVTDPSPLGKRAAELGISTFMVGGRSVVEDKDLRNDRIYGVADDAMCHFVGFDLGMADDGAGEWTRVQDSTGPADAFTGLLRFYHQIGIYQRSATGVYTNFSVPSAFQTNPSSIA